MFGMKNYNSFSISIHDIETKIVINLKLESILTTNFLFCISGRTGLLILGIVQQKLENKGFIN